ncbi:MAG: UvrB/UvrC motif-containing protein [Gemmatimonadetes bacterium]|nr:UvrB/UvrC motif-containing protein [Gemmatimonadota bacterium]
MICDQCKERDAVVYLTKIVESAVTQLHLCEKCAAESGVETTIATPKHPLGDFLKAVQQQALVPSSEATRCAACGMTLKDFRATGRLGCARCYGAFEVSLRELLRRVHGNAHHAGRTYHGPQPAPWQRANSVRELRDRLKRAIESEAFEEAASLRDELRGLE